MILARGTEKEQRTGRFVTCLDPVDLATPSLEGGALERLDEEFSMSHIENPKKQALALKLL